MPFLNALVALFSLLMLGRHGPRALLFLLPRSIRISGDADAPPRASGQVAAGERLEALGFRRLGQRHERGPLGALDMELEAWVHPDGTCADAYPAGSRSIAVSFLTTFGDGFQLGTSNFKRIGVDRPVGRVGGIEGATLEAALAAHRKAAEPLALQHGAASPVADLAARIDVAHRFYAGVGGLELRRPAFMSLLNSALALLLLASSIRLALRALGYL